VPGPAAVMVDPPPPPVRSFPFLPMVNSSPGATVASVTSAPGSTVTVPLYRALWFPRNVTWSRSVAAAAKSGGSRPNVV